jgi:hypothetical protein
MNERKIFVRLGDADIQSLVRLGDADLREQRTESDDDSIDSGAQSVSIKKRLQPINTLELVWSHLQAVDDGLGLDKSQNWFPSLKDVSLEIFE